MMKYIFLVLSLGCNHYLCCAQANFSTIESHVNFEIINAGLPVDGSFSDASIFLKLTQNSIKKNMELHGSVLVDKISTGISFRDNHLKKADYFNQEKYPEIVVRSFPFDLSDEERFSLEFYITIKEITKVIPASIKFQEENETLLFNINFDLNRLDFKLGKESVILSKNVSVSVKTKMKKVN